ncbi:MAG: hypothetical protein ITF98_06340 [Fermentimonas sp.]|nr:hypothetical protein [Fermentimonas sp.]
MPHQTINISKKLLSKTESLMLHGIGFVTGDPTINLGYPYISHPGMQITVTEPGDSKWIYMMLPVVSGSLITDIKISYHRVGIDNRILFVRLVEQGEPISATIVHDDKLQTDLFSSGIIQTSCRVLVKKSVLLKVCIDFQNTDDMIEFGQVEIKYIPNFEEITGMRRRFLRDRDSSGTENGNNSEKEYNPTMTELLLTKLNKKNF